VPGIGRPGLPAKEKVQKWALGFESLTFRQIEVVSMRMWMVNPLWMCTQHRSGEHSEIHKFRPSFLKGISIKNRVKWQQIEPTAMQTRHDELATHMNHKSPYEQPEKHTNYTEEEWNSKVNKDAALMLLLTKCPKCRKAFRENQ